VDGKGFEKNQLINLKLNNIEKIDDNDVVLTYNVIY
jgi:hypothetical protein